MKKLIPFLLTLSLFCANQPNLTPDTTIITLPTPTTDPIPVTNPPATTPTLIQAAMKTPSATMFFDGVNLTEYTTSPTQFANFRQMSVNDILTDFDQYGQPVSSVQLPIIPEHIVQYGNSIWTFETIGTQTKMWLNYAEYGNYLNNNYTIKNVYKSMLNDVIIEKPIGGFIDVTGQLVNIKYINKEGFLIHNFDLINHTATIRVQAGYHVIFSMNFMNQAVNWQYSSTLDKWYSANGYTFDTVNGLTEGTTAMWGFNSYPNIIPNAWGESPVLINITTRLENSETVLYWLECNTGQIIRYVPSIDTATVYGMLYAGDGLRATGQQLRDSLKLSVVGDDVYFNYLVNVWVFNFASGIVQNFYVGTGEVVGW